MAPTSPYLTAVPLGMQAPKHIKNTFDSERVRAYWTYQDIYNNVDTIWVAVMRDDEGNEIARRFIPSARTIIEATNRYLGKDPAYVPMPLAADPATGETIEPDIAVVAPVKQLLDNFFVREEFWAKYLSLKRWMLIRGDAVFHLTADDTKEEGQRLRLEELDPASYFDIPNPVEPTRVDGVYLVTLVPDDEGNEIAQRQSYRKQEDGTIFTQLEFFETDAWDDREPLSPSDLKPVAPPERFANSPLLAGFPLPSQITSIPVYLFRNNRRGSEPFGISELQGLETILAGVNQTATDEELTVSLQGLGVFWTTSGKPRDEQGNELPWILSPASMIELENKDDKIGRVAGATDIQSYMNHINMLEGKARETSGTPDVAIGKVDVQVAQSGIALSIQLSPILSKNSEKEVELKGKLDQMLYDLVTMWFPAYESTTAEGVTFTVSFDNPVPFDRVATLKEITDMLTAKIISIQFAQKLIKEKLGYDIPDDMLTEIAQEQQQLLDSVGSRLDAEAAGGQPTQGA